MVGMIIIFAQDDSFESNSLCLLAIEGVKNVVGECDRRWRMGELLTISLNIVFQPRLYGKYKLKHKQYYKRFSGKIYASLLPREIRITKHTKKSNKIFY